MRLAYIPRRKYRRSRYDHRGLKKLASVTTRTALGTADDGEFVQLSTLLLRTKAFITCPWGKLVQFPSFLSLETLGS